MLYTTANQEDIKVYGKLVPATKDNIVTEAKYVYDDVLGMSQSDINSTLDPAGSASTRKDNTWTGKNVFDGEVDLNGTTKINSLNVPTFGANTVTADDITAKTITVDTLNCSSYAPESIETTKVKADEVTATTGKFTTLEADSFNPDAVTATTVTATTGTFDTLNCATLAPESVTATSVTTDDITGDTAQFGTATITTATITTDNIDTANISTKLNVTGETTVDDITVGGDATVSGNLTVSGDTTLTKGFTSEETADDGKYTGEYDAKGIDLTDTVKNVSSAIDASQAKFTDGDNALTAQATSLAITDGTATNTITSTSSSIASGTDKSELNPTSLVLTDSSADPVNTLTINKNGITKTGGSATTVFSTNGGTVDMTGYASLTKDNTFLGWQEQIYKTDAAGGKKIVLNAGVGQMFMKYTLDSGRYYEYVLKQGELTYSLRESNTMMRDVVQVKPHRILMTYGYPDIPSEDTGYRLKLENTPDIKMRLTSHYTLYANQWTKDNFTLNAGPATEDVTTVNTRTASIDTSTSSSAYLALSFTDISTKDVHDIKLNACATPSLSLKKTDKDSIEQGSYYVDNTKAKWDTAIDYSSMFGTYCNGSDSAKSLKKGAYMFYDWVEDTPPTNPDSQPGLLTTTELTGAELTAKQVTIQSGATAPDHSTLTAKVGGMLTDADDFTGGTGLYVSSDQNAGDDSELYECLFASYDDVTIKHKGTDTYSAVYSALGYAVTGIPHGQRPLEFTSADNKTLYIEYYKENAVETAPAHYDVVSNADYVNFSTPIQEHVLNSLYTNNIAQDKIVLTTNSDATTKATSLTATSAGLEYYKHIENVDGTPVYYTCKSTATAEQQIAYLLPGQGTIDPDDPESVTGYKYSVTSTPMGVKHSSSINTGTGYAENSYVTVGVVNTSAGYSDSVVSSVINSDGTESYTVLNYDGITISKESTDTVNITPLKILIDSVSGDTITATSKMSGGGTVYTNSDSKMFTTSYSGLAANIQTTRLSCLPKNTIPGCSQNFFELGTSADESVTGNITAVCPLNASGNIPSTHPAEAVAPEFILTAPDGTKFKFDWEAARNNGIIVEVA